jgi:hypothetical protein
MVVRVTLSPPGELLSEETNDNSVAIRLARVLLSDGAEIHGYWPLHEVLSGHQGSEGQNHLGCASTLGLRVRGRYLPATPGSAGADVVTLFARRGNHIDHHKQTPAPQAK